jgi:quercetin dioxygenase-like cupin family protein
MSTQPLSSRITLASRDTDGTIGIVENRVRPGWPGPPLHHHAFDETFCILEGELTFQVGADRLVGRAGDTLFVARGVHHTLANLSDAPARYLLVCTPGGFEHKFGPDADSTPSGPTTDVVFVGPRIPELDAEPAIVPAIDA